MSEPNTAETESVGDSSVSSPVAELKDNYERKFYALQSEIGQLKDLMIAMIKKFNSSSIDARGQGSSTPPARWSGTSLK